MFRKKNKASGVPPEQENAPAEKKKKDKTIKPRAPKSMAGKKVIRTFFWVFMSLLILKGAIAFAQGNRTINQTIINGTNEKVVSDSVKGFAADFATEYFTWDVNQVGDRTTRLGKFIKSIDPDMGLKNFDIKDSSKVTSAEIYGTNEIDAKHVDVTVVVWREIQPLPDQLLDAQDKAAKPATVEQKTYMIVPITLADEGPVIQTYPRFVSEQQRGDTIESSTGVLVGDQDLVKKGMDLTDSYLRSWYEGNAAQLRYFYADSVKAPDTILKSDFTYQKLDKASVYEIPSGLGGKTTYRIEASVLVTSEMGETFANSWNLEVEAQEDRLYVLSNGIQYPEQSVTPIDSPAPSDTNTVQDGSNSAPNTDQ